MVVELYSPDFAEGSGQVKFSSCAEEGSADFSHIGIKTAIPRMEFLLQILLWRSGTLFVEGSHLLPYLQVLISQ